jgi:hypothetical protein
VIAYPATACRADDPPCVVSLTSLTGLTGFSHQGGLWHAAFYVKLAPLAQVWLIRSLHDGDLFLRQPIQLIYQRVDLPVGG